MQRFRSLFSSQCVSDEATCAQIARTWNDCEYLLDPHSAIGVQAALEADIDAAVPVIALATAHPAKFPDAVAKAGAQRAVDLPPHLRDLFERTERFEVLPNELSAVQDFIAQHITA